MDYALKLDTQYDEHTDTLTGVARVSAHGLTRVFSVSLPLQKIRRDVVRALSNRVGWGWSDIKKAANGIAKKVGKLKLLDKVKQIVNDPRFREGMKIASAIYPPLGISVASVQKANSLLDKVRSGDTEAQKKLVQITNLAKQGHAAAGKLATALLVLNQAHKAGVPPKQIDAAVRKHVASKVVRQHGNRKISLLASFPGIQTYWR